MLIDMQGSTIEYHHISIIIAPKKFMDLTLLVASALLAQPNNVIAPHVLARQHSSR
jgi:hypothetical protein